MSDAGDDVQGSAICNAAAAARLGFDRQRLDQFAQSIRKDVARRVSDRARVLVARRGEVAFDGVFGFADRAAGRPLKHDDVPTEADGGRPLSFDEFLIDTSIDGIVVARGGRIVFERYANGMTETTPHILS